MRPAGVEYSAQDYPHRPITGVIVSAAHAVHRALGYGFLEAVYKKALAVELRRRQLNVAMERRYHLDYCGEPIGYYDADLVVDECVIAEVKTGLLPDPVAPMQTLNYLRASGLEVGLVVHFGPGLDIRRLVKRHSDEASVDFSKLSV